MPFSNPILKLCRILNLHHVLPKAAERMEFEKFSRLAAQVEIVSSKDA
jgi:hypothetical protein